MRAQLERFTCDRPNCVSNLEQITPGLMGMSTIGSWGTVLAVENNGPGRIMIPSGSGGVQGRADVCPACFAELMAWWIDPPVEPPAPPQPQESDDGKPDLPF